jgi:hypothetical protein
MNPFMKAVQAVAKPVAKAVKTIGRNKPEIMVGAGIVAVVGSFVWVAINAAKAPEKANEMVDKVQEIEEKYKEELKTVEGEQSTETLVKQSKELRKARFDGAVEMAKLFVPPAATMTAGLVLIFFGHRMRWKEVIVLSTEVKGLKEAFRFYRQNVIEKEGKEKDLEYLRGVVGEKEIQKIGQDECGNDILKKEKAPVIKERGFCPWRFEFSPTFFDAACWDIDTNVVRLQHIENKWNKYYETNRKYQKISMWDILNDLGAKWEAIEGSFPGCANYKEAEVFARNYGWGHDIRGDDRIDFGIYRAINDGALVGRGECVYIEFNCDGNLNKIENQYKKKYCMA